MGNKKKHHQQKKEKIEEEPTNEPPQEQPQQPEQPKKELQIIEAKKVSYCPVCSFPFELCKYGKNALECATFLFKKAPTKVNKYHPDFKPDQVSDLKEKKEDKKGDKNDKEGKGKSLKEKYVVIDVKNRGKKHFITTVEGLNNFNIDAKQVSKKCSKKFAASCSVVATGSVQMQGDNFENMRQFLLDEYKQLKKKYIIPKEEFNEKIGEELAKKKEQKKNAKNVIKEEPEEEDKEGKEQAKQEIVKDKNALRFELMQKIEAGEEDDSDG